MKVIEAAFTVLREMVLRSDADDAPRRLARLTAAHRTLTDPERRAAYDLVRQTVLRELDEDLIQELLTLAVASAAPDEVMPPVDGPAGWVATRREAFVGHYRALLTDEVERVYAILVAGRAVGAGRLRPRPGSGEFEVAAWLGRSARGRGIEDAALAALAERARSLGAEAVVRVSPPPGRAEGASRA